MNNEEQIKVAILTKSNKRRNDGSFGFCVAGIDEYGEWIRLVADEDGDSLPIDVEISIGQVILITGKRVPLTYQTENFVLNKCSIVYGEDANQYVNKLRQGDEHGIFGNTSNQLSSAEMKHCKGTLRLVAVENLSTYRRVDESCKCKFTYQGHLYNDVAMTDRGWYAKEGTERKIGKASIVVGLPNSPAFNKFVAAIFQHN